MVQDKERERFIPFRKVDIVEMLCKDGKFTEEEHEKFRSFCRILETLYHVEFHEQVETFKRAYHPFNPDRDYEGPALSEEEKNSKENLLVKNLSKVLDKANYEEIKEDELRAVIERESFFRIGLYVDFDDFDKQLVFWRGDTTEKMFHRKWLFWKEEVEVPAYERVAVLIKFKGPEHFQNKKRELMFEPGSMLLKLFKNIPKADMEMLFPNTQVRMTLKDKLLMIVPAIIGGVGILGTKGVAILAAIPVLIVVLQVLLTGGDVNDIDSAQMALLIGAGTALGGIVGYGWRQWDKYKSRKIFFMKTLSENLYYRNLDNNLGVFHHLIDSAEEEEFKEAVLAYYFLLFSESGLSQEQLDGKIEDWFEQNQQVQLDFEVDDALGKLEKLGLCQVSEQQETQIYQVVSLEKALEKIDHIFDNIFQYNQQLESAD